MAPPGTGNTKPCDYPKYTGSNLVSERTPFPTRLLWTVWDVRFCSDILSSQRSQKNSSLVPVTLIQPVCLLPLQFLLKNKKRLQRAAMPGTLQTVRHWVNQPSTWKMFSVVFSLNLTSYTGSKHWQGKPHSCFTEKRRLLVFPAMLLGISSD